MTSMIGQHITFGSYSGIVVEEYTKRKAQKVRVKLDAGQTNPVLGGYGITDVRMIDTKVAWATQEELVAEYNADWRYRRDLKRAGGDATLLRR